MYAQSSFPADLVAEQFHLLGQPARLRILLALGSGDVCVCHLEKWLDLRQAYISQQLMLLRNAGLVASRREGKHIYYSLGDPDLLELISLSAKMIGYPHPELECPAELPLAGCPCPICTSTQAQEGGSNPSGNPHS